MLQVGCSEEKSEFLTGKPRNNSNRGRSRIPAGSSNKSLESLRDSNDLIEDYLIMTSSAGSGVKWN